MKKIKLYIYGAIVLVLIIMVVGKYIRQAKSDALSDAYSSVVSVRGIKLVPEPFARTIEETGILTGNKESMVATETGGRVMEIKVDVGSYVKEGDPMVRLDDELYKLDADRAKIAYDKAKMDLERLEKLYEQKSISSSDIEGARLGAKSAEVGYKAALKTYNEATIRAPFSGTVAAKLTEVGQMVERGTPVVQLVDVGSLKLVVQVDEEQLRYASIGANALVIIDALKDSVEGKVVAIGSRAVTGTRTFPIEVRVPGNGKLRSGMFARTEIVGETVSDGLLLPRVAIIPDAGRSIVFRAHGKRAEKVVVKLIGKQGERIAVEGLNAGDIVITDGNQGLTQGTSIALKAE